MTRDCTVLNAFRHQRMIHTLTSRPAMSLPNRAQRLSASKDDPQSDEKAPCRQGQQLNAFRHQRMILTLTTVTHEKPSLRAQRLSASKDDPPPESSCPPPPAECAQRLSASKDDPQDFKVFEFGLPYECSTPFGIKG